MGKEEMSLMEFDGYVTQLGIGSEVASIGINFIPIAGSYIEIINATMYIENIAANLTGFIELYNVNNSLLNFVKCTTLDNNRLIITPLIADDKQANNNNQAGFSSLPIILGSLMNLLSSINSLDATKKLQMSIMYKTRNGIIPTISAFGAGITLTTTKHIQI